MAPRVQSYRIEAAQSLGGELRVPGDKSISHRAVMLGGLARGQTRIRGFLESEDCLATLAALGHLGVAYERGSDGSLVIDGAGQGGFSPPTEALDLGNSGTAMRLLLGLLAGQNIAATLTGDASLRQRPMERIAEPLRAMGAAIRTTAGTAPVQLERHAGLHGIVYELPVASAQIKSALLLAALGASGRTAIRSPAPTRDHSERMLTAMGARLEHSDDGLSVALEGPQALGGREIDVPGDLSSAAFFIVGGLLNRKGSIVIRRVGINPTRDGVLAILRLMGARIELENRSECGNEPVADLRVYAGELHGVTVPESLVPLAIDELPVVFVAAAAARGRTIVSGASELRVKESDRLGVMARALAAVGAEVRETDDGMIIDGGAIRGGIVDSAGDHRIAMSFAIASLAAEGPIEVRNTAPVATSFPGFVETAARAGLAISVSEA